MAFARSLASCACLLVAGCAAVSTAGGERLRLASPEFRAYVERVFREQNRVAGELAFALEAPGDSSDDLAGIEDELLRACAPVNELATARRDERRLPMKARLAAARTVPECERATEAASAALTRR